MSTLDRHRDALSGTARSPEAPAARFARARVSARSWLIAGAVLMPVILGAFWLKSGHIDRLAVFVTIGVTTLVDVIGVAQLLMLGRAMERHRRRIATKNFSPLQIQFCRTSLGRLGPETEPLLTALRERGHTPIVKECLNRCQDCKLGMLVATADGAPLCVPDGTKLLGELDELAAAENP